VGELCRYPSRRSSTSNLDHCTIMLRQADKGRPRRETPRDIWLRPCPPSPLSLVNRRSRIVAANSLWLTYTRTNSTSLTSTGTWTLIAIAVSACWGAWATSKQYRREKTSALRDSYGPRHGLLPRSSFNPGRSELRITSRSGFASNSRSGSSAGCGKWNPRKDFIHSKAGWNTGPERSRGKKASPIITMFASRFPALWENIRTPREPTLRRM